LTKASKLDKKAGPHDIFPEEDRLGRKLEIRAEREVKSWTGLIQLGLRGSSQGKPRYVLSFDGDFLGNLTYV
jgi:hypothetical protein